MTADRDIDHDVEREAELAASLAAVRARLDAACAAACRPPGDVRLLAVTKTFPAADVVRLVALGCADVGENRDQEAKAKAAEVADLCAQAGLPLPRWHMIGQVQRKKARSVAQWAGIVETVDRIELAHALGRAAADTGRVLDVCIQVSLDPPDVTGRGGARPDDVPALADAVAAEPGLALAGLMAVAPHPGDPGEAFARLAVVRERLLASHPEATMLSAGMSGDVEEAVAHGATQARIGGAILGNRPVVQ